jgi:hypothetical protein
MAFSSKEVDQPLGGVGAMTRQADLRAMQRLLGYAYTQSRILNLPHVELLLDAAAIALDDTLTQGIGQSSTAPRSQLVQLHASDDALRRNVRRA